MMRPTSVGELGAGAAIVGLFAAVLLRTNYGLVPAISIYTPGSLYVLAALNVLAAVRVRRALGRERGIGHDASQLDPLTVVRLLVFGRASAVLGAIFVGFFAALAVYTGVHRTTLAAAAADFPGAVVGLVGALAVLVAGIVLERSCRVPPRDGGETGADGGEGRAGRDGWDAEPGPA